MNAETTGSDMLFLYPTHKDWVRIESQIDWGRVEILHSDFNLINDNSLDQFSRSIDLDSWVLCSNNRIFDIRKSYIFLMFYYEQGIPDDKWWSQDTGHVRYFPNFEPKHYFIKTNFDYYADTFYYKMFSSWDTVGQIINIAFNLRIPNEDVTFYRAHQQLKNSNTVLYDRLNLLINENEFKKAKKLRNALTHNYPPLDVSSPVTKISSNAISLGIGQYTTSTEIKENVIGIMELLAKAIQAIKK